MTDIIDLLQNRYWDWVRAETTVSDLGGIYEITTPYLDRFNDCIQLYAKVIDSDRILITDGGETLEDMSLSDYSLSSGKWTPIFQEILNGFNISLNRQDNSLCAECSVHDFPVVAHNIIQAILAVNDVSYISTSGKVSEQASFRKKVEKEIYSLDWDVNAIPSFLGRSGASRKFNFMVKSAEISTVIQCFGSIDRTRIDAFTLSWLDTIGNHDNRQVRCSALIQDQTPQNKIDTACTIMECYDIKTVVASSGIRSGLHEIMTVR